MGSCVTGSRWWIKAGERGKMQRASTGICVGDGNGNINYGWLYVSFGESKRKLNFDASQYDNTGMTRQCYVYWIFIPFNWTEQAKSSKRDHIRWFVQLMAAHFVQQTKFMMGIIYKNHRHSRLDIVSFRGMLVKWHKNPIILFTELALLHFIISPVDRRNHKDWKFHGKL